MKILQIIILFFGLWIINLIKYLVLYEMKLFKNEFNQDLIREYQFVKLTYQFVLITTIFNLTILIIGNCVKNKTFVKMCSCLLILNINCFYLINLVVINLFRETLNLDSKEIIICICWIIFLTWIYVQLNGKYEDIINKFSSFGIIKIICLLTLDLQSIIFQIYICVAFGITNNSIENIYISLILISIPLILSIGQGLYVVYYVNKQIFTIFGTAKIEFQRYSQFKKVSIGILLYTIILEFLKSNTVFDLLFMFFVYGSIRLCNLRMLKRSDKSIPLLSSQFTTIIMANNQQPLKCSNCQKEYTHLDKIIQCMQVTFHKQCKYQVQLERLVVYQQINLRNKFHESEQKIQFHTNLLLILITALDFIYYITRSCLLTQNYNLQDIIIRVSQIILYNIIIFLQDSLKKKVLKLRVILLFLVYLSYYIHLYHLYFQINIYDETESTVFAIVQNLLLLLAQSINLLMIQQVYYPILDLNQAIILYFLRTLTINQVIYLFVYAYQIYDVDDNYLFLSQIPVVLYFAIYLINFDRLSITNIFKMEFIQPYLYFYHQKLSQLFLIILSVYQLFQQLFHDDDYINNVHLKFKFFLFGCVVFTFRINEVTSQNYMKLTFQSIQQKNLWLPSISDFDQICLSNCQCCHLKFQNEDIIIHKNNYYYHKQCNKQKYQRQIKIWKMIQ